MASWIILRSSIFLILMIFIRNGVCKMEAECPKYWDHRTGTNECYYLHLYGHSRARDDANDYCKRNGGKLVYILDQETKDWLSVHIADEGLVGENAQIWVNAQKQDDGTWKWPEVDKPVDNSLLPWVVEGEDADSKCAVYTQEQKLLKKNCDTHMRFICHRDIRTPMMCDMGNDWYDQNGRCYKLANDKQSWHDAAVSCEMDDGGWLMKVDGDYESYYLYDESVRIRDNIWIGLTEEGHPGKWKWYHGDENDYRKWNEDKGEPISRNGFGSAIVDHDDTDGGGRWKNEDIKAHHRYMCEKDKGACVSGWQSYKKNCYYFNSLASDNSVFETAKTMCTDVGARLVIINDALENAFLFETMAGDDQLWIGLYTIPHDKFMWVNGKSMKELNFTMLSDSEVDNTITTEDDQKCVFIKYIKDENNKDVPKWVIGDCTQQKHFLCEIGNDADLTIPPPSSDIFCPEGWTNWGDHCYHFVADELAWTAAQTECKKVQGADLASITSWPENDYIHNNVIALSWIGLNDRAQDGSYRWSDGSHVNIKNWAEGEPSEGDENCVQMYEGGKWNDLRCDKKNPYVCKMAAADHPVGPIEITTPNTTPDYDACGWDWIENPVSGECYRVETEKLTWYDARSHCRYLGDDYHGHDHDIQLVSLTTAQEQEFVYSMIVDANINSPDVWTGLQADYDGIHWTDETPLHFFNFNDGEPNSYGAEPCIEMYMDSGKWNDQDCNKRSAFVCEKKGENYVGPTDPPIPDVRCPKGWNFFNDFCYLQEIADTKDWDTAHSFCKDQYGGELTSVTSQEENDFILGIIQNNYVDAWLGLHDDNNGSNWHWTDGNNLDFYTNWMDGEPNNYDGNEHCGEITADAYTAVPGAWNDVPCNEIKSFLCKISVTTCLPGWQFKNDGCYYISNLEKTWSASRQSCKEMNENSDLVSIHNDEDNSFFSSMLNAVSESAWLGYKYRNGSDKWTWSDGSPSDYENWNTGEPNNNDTEWCSESINWQGDATHGKWNNLACSENRFYGCEMTGANITHTVGCEQDWLYFNNYCYYYSDINYDTYGLTYSEAVADCQNKGSSIASIHSVEENDFVYAMAGYDYYTTMFVGLSAEGHGDLLWSDNTDITYTNWALIDTNAFWSTNLCAVFDISYLTGQWNLGDCEVPSYYVCKKSAETVPINPPDQTGCKGDDVSYKGSCYNFQEEENTWQAAEDDCISDYNGHTVVINDQFENAFISSYLKGRGSHWWTGLKGTAADDGSVSFAWVNGDPLDYTNWEEYEPSPDRGLCVAASGHDTLPGFWETSSCDEYRHYICEYDNNNYVPPTPPSTQPPPPPNCATNWTHNQDEQRCYKVFSSPRTWGLAENHCKTLGGHLTSVGSAEEQTFIKTLPGISDLNMTFPKIWIGLHQGSESGYEWTDGTPEGYLDWDEGQPDSEDHREDCVAAKKDSFKETDDECDSFYSYICEVEQGMSLTTLSPPTEGPVSHCDEDPDWLLYDDHCYKIVSASDEQNSFWTSQKRCQDDGAELVSIHSAEENAFINSRIYSLSDDQLWLGGLANFDGGFHWTDNSSFAYFNWAKGEPNNWHDQESCVSIYTNHDNGYWNDVNCASVQGRICKRPNGKTLPPPVTLPPPNGHCPDGWIHIGSRCIKLFSGDNTTNWDTARMKCKEQGDGIDLISVHSEEDQAAVTALVGRSGRNAWLGFFNKNGFHWSDQSEADYTHWAAGEPNGNQDVKEDCGLAYYWNGEWNDAPCKLTADYICQRGIDSGIATHKPPPPCSGQFVDSGYFNYSGACYRPMNVPKSWQDAESSCQDEDAHLASVESIAENSYIYLLGKEAGTGVNGQWIGFNSLKDTNDNRHFEWSDGWPTLFSNWGPGSPNASLTDHRCTFIDGNDGLWYTRTCDEKRPFVCKYSENTIPTPDPPSTGYCPDNRWQNLGGGYCYLINKDAHTWSQANQACISEGVKDSPSSLVSIHSGAEKDLILKISETVLSPMWIGLIQQQLDFGWSDGTALDYINWDEGEPNSDDEQCGTVKPHSGLWNDLACDNVLPFICKMKKIQISEPTNPPVTAPPKPGTTTAGPGEYKNPGLSAGGIVGIVIAVLFVVAFVGVLGYQHHTKPKPTVAYFNPAQGRNSTQKSSSIQDPVDIGTNVGYTDA